MVDPFPSSTALRAATVASWSVLPVNMSRSVDQNLVSALLEDDRAEAVGMTRDEEYLAPRTQKDQICLDVPITVHA